MLFINMVGRPCPLPVIEAKKALREALPGDHISILVDNDMACQNLRKMAEGLGHQLRHELTDEGFILASIFVGDETRVQAASGPGLVLAIGSEAMGSGSEELGRALMKSFIFSLSELEPLPERILFFNGGVRLSCEGAATLADLESLAEKGVVIHSCGACLNFYGLTDKLRVGEVGNMYEIVKAMAEAGRLIRL